jgi:hypothetical protein
MFAIMMLSADSDNNKAKADAAAGADDVTEALVQPLETTRRFRLLARGFDTSLFNQTAVRLVILMHVAVAAFVLVLWRFFSFF